MSHLTFLQDLAIVMIVAGLVTIVFHRFRLPVVLGYILAGLIIGPHTLPTPLIGDEETIKTLSELGIIFLMFNLGLEFSLRKLKQVGATALVAATLEILLMIGIGYGIGRAFGWNTMDSLFLGAILSISSTTIIMRAFNEQGLNKERFSNLVFGILIVEDILGIVLIALLTGLARTGTLQSWEAVITLGQLAVFLVVSFVLGLLAVPRILGYVARFRSDEMMLITVLGLCFGFSLLAVKLGFSVALGAFLMGAIVAEAKEIHKVERLMLPVRDMFSAVFFVSVGLLIEPKLLVDYALPITVITIAVIVGQAVTVALGAYAAGQDFRTATRVGLSMTQIGEFSFIIAGIGLSLGVTSHFLYPIAVSVSALTTLSTPFLVRSSEPFTLWLERKLPSTLLSYLNLYSRWLDQFTKGRQNSMVRKILRRIGGQLVIFLGLIAGSILAAVFISKAIQRFFPAAAKWQDLINSALWLTAMLAAMPVYIAATRKLKALGMILAELGITDAMGGERKQEIRAVVANAILAVGLLALAAFTFGLSYAVLPPVQALVLLLVLVGVLWRLKGPMNKVYFQGKASLVDTFSRPSPAEAAASETVTDSLRDARLDFVPVGEGMAAVGRTLKDLGLEPNGGESGGGGGVVAVAIERGGTRILRPEDHDELAAGDLVVLLGPESRLPEARARMTGNGGNPGEAKKADAA